MTSSSLPFERRISHPATSLGWGIQLVPVMLAARYPDAYVLHASLGGGTMRGSRDDSATNAVTNDKPNIARKAETVFFMV